MSETVRLVGGPMNGMLIEVRHGNEIAIMVASLPELTIKDPSEPPIMVRPVERRYVRSASWPSVFVFKPVQKDGVNA